MAYVDLVSKQYLENHIIGDINSTKETTKIDESKLTLTNTNSAINGKVSSSGVIAAVNSSTETAKIDESKLTLTNTNSAINGKVSSSGVIAAVNASSEKATINEAKLNLTNTNSAIDAKAPKATIIATINASSESAKIAEGKLTLTNTNAAINEKVPNASVIAKINASTESVKINENKLTLTNTNAAIDAKVPNASVIAKINASSETVKINENRLTLTNTNAAIDAKVPNASVIAKINASTESARIAIGKLPVDLSTSYLKLVNLGTSYTAELKNDISSGKFEKAIVGGYLTINSYVYYFAHPDYWLHCGDTACETHHMLVVPAGNLSMGKMNATNITEGAYLGSDLKTGKNGNTALADAAAIIKADFGAANILSHREFFANAVANGKQTSGAWADSDIDLMNEEMVYGCPIFQAANDGQTIPYNYTIDKTQIKLFRERPDLITTRAPWWLRDVVSGAYFANVALDGLANTTGASTSRGVRPAFAVH